MVRLTYSLSSLILLGLGLDGLTPLIDINDLHHISITRHPDKNQDNQEEAQKKFQEISAAFEVLSDPEKKKVDLDISISMCFVLPVLSFQSNFFFPSSYTSFV